MYLAMDDFGDDYLEELKKFNNEDKWKRIAEIARVYSFTGIQVNPNLYEYELGLSLKSIPLTDFTLSYHIGGVYYLCNKKEVTDLFDALAKALQIAKKNGIGDVSFHPPLLLDEESRLCSREHFSKVLGHFLPKYNEAGIKLSLETHVTEQYFIFRGLKDYAEYMKDYPELGILIDISHLCYDGYSVSEVLETIDIDKVTGIHLSDANKSLSFKEGTHMTIGTGLVDFELLIKRFKEKPIYGVFEVKGNSESILKSIAKISSFL